MKYGAVSWSVVCGAIVALLTGCPTAGPTRAAEAVQSTHIPAMIVAIRTDIERQRRGIREAAERLAPGFVVEDATKREKDIRFALRYLGEPPRGISEFISSPMSFLAAVDKDGKVIARDVKKVADDQMKGQDFAAEYPIVKEALAGKKGTEGLVAFGTKSDKEASYSMAFAHPAVRDGAVVGAAVSGIPLWRWAQRLSRQGQLELAKESAAVYWVFAWKGDKLFPPQEGLDLQKLLPPASERATKLAANPKGYSGKFEQFGRWYAYGVLPVPSIAQDVGFIVVRGEPTK